MSSGGMPPRTAMLLRADDPTVLPYTHFSVVMNRRRQLAYYTVVNIDGNQSKDLSRGRDRWYFDSRIAESEQIGERSALQPQRLGSRTSRAASRSSLGRAGKSCQR
jgi:DNA/RNA endonuclease G (NUC1)